MTNADMIANRYARWARYRKLERMIKEQLAQGRTVIASTYWKHTKLTAKNDGNLKSNRNGLWIQSGKSWVDISLCGFTVH